MRQRKLILTLVGLWLAVGGGFGVYAGFHWIIPFMDTVMFPWMAHLERTIGRFPGLAVIVAIFVAAQVLLIAVWVRYVKAVRGRLKQR